MMYTNDMAFGWGGMILGPLMMLGFLAIVIILFMTVAKSMNSSGSNSTRRDAQDILKERFAMGEIDEQQFEQMRRTLD